MDSLATIGIAATISTALATGVSTLAAIWWRRMDRREADWAWLDAGASWKVAEGKTLEAPNAVTELANAGDGSAFRVKLTGHECKVSMFRPITASATGISSLAVPLVPVMHPGDEIGVRVKCSTIEQWTEAKVVIEWARSPTWRKRRSHRKMSVRLSEIVDKPEPDAGH